MGILVCTPRAIPMRLDPLFYGMLESSDEEARSDPEHHQTIGGLQRRDQPHAAAEHYVAITQRRERCARKIQRRFKVFTEATTWRARHTIVANKPSERIPITAPASLPYKLPSGVSVLLQPKRQCDEDHAQDHGISADDPDERKRTGTGGQHHTDTE
jgi:hypothetical protein